MTFSSIELTLTISLFSFKRLLLNVELNILCTAKLVKTSHQENLGFVVPAAMKEQWFYTRYLLHHGKNKKLNVLFNINKEIVIASYYIDKSVLVENGPLVKFIRNYIRDSSGVFSISSLVRISMMSFPTLTLLFVHKYSCLYNKRKITRWLEDMNFIFSW